ncbi:hypothetical protein FACS1894218_6550 [Bacilli bacterium]|nr:hypothetical protein FACS1894218_6550 [Bacilli bacterium]
MCNCIKNGLSTAGTLPGKLKLKRHAKEIYDSKVSAPNKLLIAYAFAVSETNASGGVVVTAPTCGACGVLPAVLYFAQKELKLSNEKILEALAIAGLVGNITRTNGSIAGAEAGCQAEIGTACAMAAAAYGYLIGLSNEDIFCAASSALEHHLGLTCDPVLGYVQSPCIERNALCAPRAIDAANLISLKNNRIHIFNYDDIVLTMLETGKALNPGYRETSLAGLSNTYSNKKKLSKKDFNIKVS